MTLEGIQFCGAETYRSGNYYPDTLLIYPYKLDCGIPAADGLDNSFRSYNCHQQPPKKAAVQMDAGQHPYICVKSNVDF